MTWLRWKLISTFVVLTINKQIQVAFLRVLKLAQAEHFVDLAQSFSEAILDSSSGCPRCGTRVRTTGDLVPFGLAFYVRKTLAPRYGAFYVVAAPRPEMSRFKGTEEICKGQNNRKIGWILSIRSKNPLFEWKSNNNVFHVEYPCRTKDSFDPPADAVIFVGHWDSDLAWSVRDMNCLSGFCFPTPIPWSTSLPVILLKTLEGLPSNNRTCGNSAFSSGSFTRYFCQWFMMYIHICT